MNHDGRGFINLTPWSLVQLEPRFFRFSTQPEARIALELEDVFQVANKLVGGATYLKTSMQRRNRTISFSGWGSEA